MASTDEAGTANPSKKPRRAPGFLQSKRTLHRLRRFQDLLRHRYRWATEMDFARPLGELIPGAGERAQPPGIIDHELQKLQPLVCRDLRDAGIPTLVKLRRGEAARRYDLIADYETLCGQDTSWAESFTQTIAALNQGIGMYEAAERRALWRAFNPIRWFAYVLRLPLTVLDEAGLTDERTPAFLLGAYAWLVRLVVLLGLFYLTAKLGIAVEWTKLFPSVLLR